MNKKFYAFNVLVAILLAGCATYKMPGLSADKNAPRAFLEHQDKSLTSKFFITEIDGKSRGIGFIDRFELQPGRRSITAAINGGIYSGDSITRYFTAEAGKHYVFVVTDDVKAQRWTFAIIDQETRFKVDSAYR
jgi:hypothetical protein